MVAQDISKPLFAVQDATTDQICVTPALSEREAVATANRSFLPNTRFILELSDEGGVFDTNPRELASFVSTLGINATDQINFPFFTIPDDLRSDDYRIRVRYIEPNSNTNIGAARVVAIHFFDNTERVTLRGPNPNTNVVALCDGESITLSVTPETLGQYQWYFNDSLIADATGTSLENVVQPGKYTVISDFGSCNDRFSDNESTVTVVNFNKTTVTIIIIGGDGLLGQEFCPEDTKVLRCSIAAAGLIYEWSKDGKILEGETGPEISLPKSNFAGIYTVKVTGTNTCFETTNSVEIINKGSNILTQPPPELILLPTEPTLTLEITTDAPPGSTVEWFKDGVSIGAPVGIPDNHVGRFSIDVTTPGTYRVDVMPSDVDCNGVLQAETIVHSPTGFAIQITNILNCEEGTGALGIENLFGTITGGGQVAITTDQYSSFDFEWFLGTQSTGVTETTFTVTESNIGEVYALEATLRGASFPTARSNDLTVEFLSDVVVIEASPAFIPFGETSTLSVPQSSNYTYEWFTMVDGDPQSLVDGSTVISGQGTNSIVVDTTGDYFVRITLSDCVIDSEILSISDVAGSSEIIPNVVTPNNDGINDSWLLPPSLFNQQEVEVTIYNIRGQVDFTSSGYQNNWPRENSKSLGQDPFYYYIITKNNSVIRKGSITVMR
jgi:gliding motility-associated-like protein